MRMAPNTPSTISALSQPRSARWTSPLRKNPKKSPMNNTMPPTKPSGPNRRQYAPTASTATNDARASPRCGASANPRARPAIIGIGMSAKPVNCAFGEGNSAALKLAIMPMIAPSRMAVTSTPWCCAATAATAAACAAEGSEALACSACVHPTKRRSASIAKPIVATACDADSSRIRPGSEPRKRSTHWGVRCAVPTVTADPQIRWLLQRRRPPW